jgi:hypothetical protein
VFNYLSPLSCVIALLNQVIILTKEKRQNRNVYIKQLIRRCLVNLAMINAKAQEITYIIAMNLRYNTYIIHKYEKRKIKLDED